MYHESANPVPVIIQLVTGDCVVRLPYGGNLACLNLEQAEQVVSHWFEENIAVEEEEPRRRIGFRVNAQHG